MYENQKKKQHLDNIMIEIMIENQEKRKYGNQRHFFYINIHLIIENQHAFRIWGLWALSNGFYD